LKINFDPYTLGSLLTFAYVNPPEAITQFERFYIPNEQQTLRDDKWFSNMSNAALRVANADMINRLAILRVIDAKLRSSYYPITEGMEVFISGFMPFSVSSVNEILTSRREHSVAVKPSSYSYFFSDDFIHWFTNNIYPSYYTLYPKGVTVDVRNNAATIAIAFTDPVSDVITVRDLYNNDLTVPVKSAVLTYSLFNKDWVLYKVDTTSPSLTLYEVKTIGLANRSSGFSFIYEDITITVEDVVRSNGDIYVKYTAERNGLISPPKWLSVNSDPANLDIFGKEITLAVMDARTTLDPEGKGAIFAVVGEKAVLDENSSSLPSSLSRINRVAILRDERGRIEKVLLYADVE